MSTHRLPIVFPRRPRALGLVLAACPAIALAHPGDHGSDWLQALMHLVSEPDHLAGGVLAAALAVWGIRALLRRRAARGSAGEH